MRQFQFRLVIANTHSRKVFYLIYSLILWEVERLSNQCGDPFWLLRQIENLMPSVGYFEKLYHLIDNLPSILNGQSVFTMYCFGGSLSCSQEVFYSAPPDGRKLDGKFIWQIVKNTSLRERLFNAIFYRPNLQQRCWIFEIVTLLPANCVTPSLHRWN